MAAAVRAVRRFLPRLPDAREEIRQETFFLAFQRLHQLRKPEKLEPWLVRIARNCVADHERRAIRRRAASLPADLADAPTRGGWIWEEVALLPGSLAEVLRRRYLEGRTYREIARLLDVPVSTVRGRIHLARRALRRRLTAREDER